MKKFVSITALVAFTAVSLAWATAFVLGQFKPEEELRRMLIAMSEVKTVEENAAISWTRDQDDGEGRVTTTVFTKGQVRLEDWGSVEHGTKFRVVQVTEEGEDADLSGEMRLLEDITYLTYAPPGPDVPGLTFEGGVWLSMNEDERRIWGPIIPGIEIPLTVEHAPPTPWTPETLSVLRAYLRYANVFHVENAELTEVVAGVATRIFDVRIDRDAAGAFLRDVIRFREQREPTNDERLLTETQAAALSNLTIRLWIGTDDHLLYRIQAAGLVDEGDGTSLTPVDLLIHLENYDAPFSVQEPVSVVPLEQFASELGAALPTAGFATGTAAGDTLLGSEDARLPVVRENQVSDRDGDGLSELLEAFYGTDPDDPDTDGDGATDGDEVLHGKNPRGSGSLFGFGLP